MLVCYRGGMGRMRSCCRRGFEVLIDVYKTVANNAYH
jgi:hypothetical protein